MYGRRRVEKTHLIRQHFTKEGIYFEASGAKDKPLKTQLENFIKEFSKIFFKGVTLQIPSSWDKAFDILTKELENIPTSKRVTIFLDELPWMATKRSGLLQSLDYFWNLHWSKMPNLILIVCGSAASWMLEKLIYAKRGLYNRITKKILLKPFTLKETKEFLESRSIRLNQQQILNLYMSIGGIPHYLKGVKKGLSASQNIDEMCFQKNGALYNEFENLYKSLFDRAETHLTIVKEIIKHGNKISRENLIKVTKIKSGGTLKKLLKELESSGFIQGFLPYGRKSRNQFYRVIDEFTLFYLRWVEPLVASVGEIEEIGYW